MSKSKKAFTLIELLVVIAIIGLLATISVIALNNARAKARDTKRVADIKQVQTALELFFNDKGRYPTYDEFAAGSIFSTSTNGTTTYMTIIPAAANPPDGSCASSTNVYAYHATADGASYSIGYCIGNTTGALAAGPKCATPAGVFNIDCSNICSASTACGETCSYGGDNYLTVQIGAQCWFKENLKTIKYNDNSDIPNITDQTEWADATSSAYCWYGNSYPVYGSVYGALYNWYAVDSASNGGKNLCPSGWHVPSDTEITTLEVYLGGSAVAGDKLKEAGTVHWVAPNTGATNSSGFTALPAGYRWADGIVSWPPHVVIGLWSSTAYSSYAWARGIGVNDPSVSRDFFYLNVGFSVRCLKN